MKHGMEDCVKVSVTKSRPGQLVGLSLDEQDGRIMVTDVFGLFKHNNLPVHIGDELLDVNGNAVTNKHEFPRGLKDVQMILRREWYICVKVRKGESAPRDETTEEKAVETFGIVAKETKKWNDDHRERIATAEDWDSEDSSLNSSGSDNDDEGTNNSNERPSRSAKPRRKRAPRSSSPFSAFSRDEKRKGKKKSPDQLKSFEESMSDSLSNITGTTQEMSTDDDTPPRTEPRTCQTGKLVDIDENDPVLVSPLSPDNETKPQSRLEIKSIHGNESGITLELDDGKTVSISPEQLLAAVSEHKGLDDSITSMARSFCSSSESPTEPDPDEKPKSESEETTEKAKSEKPEKSKSEKTKNKRSKSRKRDRTKNKAPRRSSMPPLPSQSDHTTSRDSTGKTESSIRTTDLSSLRNLLNDKAVRVSISDLLAQHTDEKSTDKPSSYSSRMSTVSRTNTATKEFMDELRQAPKAPRRSSMPMLPSDSSLKRLTSITETKQKQESDRSFKTKKKRSKSPDSLPDETSFHSTRACMTNLIDPGDLMKIHGFKSKPMFNGATVEVVRKSKGQKGKRWDVRVVSKKHIENTSFNSKRMISVLRDNLQHFR